MIIDQREIDCLRSASDEFQKIFDNLAVGQEFDDAYVTFLQSYRRILLIAEQAPKKPSGTEMAEELTGNACSRCMSVNLIRKGGCITCRDCKHSEGCGG